MKNKELPHRKPTHFRYFDYSENHRYFVTICSDKKRKLFSDIVVGEGLAPPAIKLSSIGKIIEEQIVGLHFRYAQITIENYVIMSNHIHMLLRLENDSGGASPSPTLHDLVCTFKSLVTRSCKQKGFQGRLWQRSYYEHIIRNENDYKNIYLYIDNNPAHWAEDEYY